MDKLDINQINPKYWGNHGWIFLNSIGLTFNPDNKTDYEQFYSLLGKLLPCSKCKQHINNNLDKLPEALDNKVSLLNWLLDLRNGVKNSKKNNLNDLYNEIFYDNNINECIDVCELPFKINSKKQFTNGKFVIILFIIGLFILKNKKINKIKRIIRKIQKKLIKK